MKRSIFTYLALAISALAAGALVYGYLRPQLLSGSSWNNSPALQTILLISGFLPDFLHTYAFILLTFITLGVTSKYSLHISMAFWLLVESLFEIGQHPFFSHFFARLEAFASGSFFPIPFVTGYFLHGTFDPLDLSAIFLAALAAFFTTRYFQNQEHSYEQIHF